MTSATIRTDESLALVLAVLAHAALFAWLAIQRPAPPPPLPERMTVTLSDDLGPLATSPEPLADPAPDLGPVLGEEPAEPAPAVTSEPKPSPKALAKAPAPKVPPKAPPKTPPKKGGAASFDETFGPGTPGAIGKQQTKNPPAANVGPAVRSALSAAIMRQIKPKWQGRVPQGIDTDKLVSIITIELNLDGSLVGPPKLMSQEGINESNRAQAKRHAEEAVRAVQLAAPFNLPADLYEAWKRPPALKMRKSN